MSKVVPEHFVAGRDAYVSNVPFLEVVERIDSLGDANEDAVSSFVFGFLDGVLADIRLAGKNAHEEIEARK